MQRKPFSQKERRLLALCGLLMLLLIGGGSWWTWSNTTPQIVIPAPPAPKPNAFDFYVKAAKAFVFVPGMDVEPGLDVEWDAPLLNAARTPDFKKRFPVQEREIWLAKNATLLGLIRQGFAFPCQVPQEGDSRTFTLSRLLSIECWVHGAHGNHKEAARSALDCIHLGTDVCEGGGLIPFIQSQIIINQGLRGLRAVRDGLDASSSRAAALEIHQRLAQYPAAAEMLKIEKINAQKRLLEIFGSDGWRELIAGSEFLSNAWERGYRTPTFRGQIEDKVEEGTIWLKGLPLSKQTVLSNYNEVVDAAIAAAQKPYAPLQLQGKDPFSRGSASTYEGKHLRYYSFRLRMTTMETTLALRAYRLERGSYPDSLDTLAPSYLPAVPRDAFTDDKPLRYKPEGAGYKLWSIGPDGKDDGGVAVINTSRPNQREISFDANSNGDLAYSINH